MKRQDFARFMRLLLVVAALALTIGTAAAETKKASRPANCGPITVTDAAGRKHQRLRLNCTTPADRKAAAKRLRLQRAAAAQKAGVRR